MSEGFMLQASVRQRVGKGAARQLRREGLIPAVIYGNKQAPLPIAIPYKEAFVQLHAGGFLTNVWTIDVDGSKVRVLARDYQLEPVKDFLVHVDFLRVTADTRVTVEVPLTVINEDASPGVRQGGVLSLVEFTLAVEAPADAIPDRIELDATGLETGATVTLADLSLPEGTHAVGEPDTPVATLTAPTEMEEEEEADTAPLSGGSDAAASDESGATTEES